eukprot:594652-Pleurochrysis_carterae.AAC.2
MNETQTNFEYVVLRAIMPSWIVCSFVQVLITQLHATTTKVVLAPADVHQRGSLQQRNSLRPCTSASKGRWLQASCFSALLVGLRCKTGSAVVCKASPMRPAYMDQNHLSNA